MIDEKKVALKVLTKRLTQSALWLDGKVGELIDIEVSHLVDDPKFYAEGQPEEGMRVAFRTLQTEFEQIKSLLSELGVVSSEGDDD